MAYFIPGTIMIISAMSLLALTDTLWFIPFMEVNLALVVLGIVLAYFLGIAVSGPVSFIEDQWRKHQSRRGKQDPRAYFHFSTAIKEDIKDAYYHLFDEEIKDWTKDNFYVARSLIKHLSPSLSEEIERQSSLRQMRRNSIVPALTCVIAILSWSIHLLRSDYVIALGLFIGAAFGVLMIISMFSEIKSNSRRECREVCTALLVIYKTQKKLN